jgi:hypothetical protein
MTQNGLGSICGDLFTNPKNELQPKRGKKPVTVVRSMFIGSKSLTGYNHTYKIMVTSIEIYYCKIT